MRILGLALVRPRLDYGVQVWFPCYKMDIRVHLLKSVQGMMTKITQGLRNLYSDRLKEINLSFVERRRVIGNLTEIFKCDKEFNKGDTCNVFIINKQIRTRSNGYKSDQLK